MENAELLHWIADPKNPLKSVAVYIQPDHRIEIHSQSGILIADADTWVKALAAYTATVPIPLPDNPPPSPAREELPPFTRQQLINAVYAACRTQGCEQTAWSVIVAAEMEWLAKNRTDIFVGAHIRDTKLPANLHDGIIKYLVQLKSFSTNGKEILLNGKPFRFMGANMRALAWYGTPVMPYASDADVKIQLDTAKTLGFKVIRFYAPHHQRTPLEAIRRTQMILDQLQQRGLYGLITLTDAQHSGFHVPGDDAQRTPMYTKEWYRGGYRKNYLPFVQQLVSEVGSHPAVFAIAIGNEMQIHPYKSDETKADAEMFLTFFDDVSKEIRKRTNALITTGLQATWNLFVTLANDKDTYGKKLYQLPNLDFVTLHTYQTPDFEAMGIHHPQILREVQYGKPVVIEEIGAVPDQFPRSAEWLDSTIRKLLNLGVSGVMQWAFQATTYDIGDGDNSGMTKSTDHSLPGQLWEDYARIYRKYADEVK